jgi:hypothetical protein
MCITFRVIRRPRYQSTFSFTHFFLRSSSEVAAEAELEMFKMYDAVKEDEPKTKQQL